MHPEGNSGIFTCTCGLLIGICLSLLLVSREVFAQAIEDGRLPSSAAVPGSFIVRFNPDLRQTERSRVLDQAGFKWHPLGQKNGSRPFARQGPQRQDGAGNFLDGFAMVEIDPESRKAGALQRLKQSPGVQYIEPNYRIHTVQTSPSITPNDFEFPELWNLNNTGQNSGVAGADIHATKAWAITKGSKQVLVAVIDTGIDYLHPDLIGNIWRNPREVAGNGVDDDGNGWIDDIHGYDFVSDDSDPLDDGLHGTHVAGIIGAQGNNQIGISGVCWEVSLMAVKAFDETGNSDVAQVIAALQYAVANKARIINASWGLPIRSRALEDTIRDAHNRGILIVAAAGNEGSDAPFYPAAMPETVSVAATDRSDRRAIFSRSGSTLDLSAPGDSILSTIPNNRYDILGGTSMAAPHVTGVAALVMSKHPEFTNLEVETILKNSVDPVNSDRFIGAGRINAFKAVQVDAPLPQVRLNVPSTISGTIDILGSVEGPRVAGYSVEIGAGENPDSWTGIHDAAGTVTEGTLTPAWYSARFADGTYSLRLTATNDNGQAARQFARVEIRNVAIFDPANNDVIRFGGRIPIRGSVYGTNVSYTIEIGKGREPASWSSVDITLTSNGRTAVSNNILGFWDASSGLDTAELYAMRLTAQVDGRTNLQDTVSILLPDKRLKPGFPVHVPIRGELPLDEWRNIVVEDLDGDGLKEIIFVDPGNLDGEPSRLVVLEHDGAQRWSRIIGRGEPLVDIPVVGDIDGDGKMEIVAGSGSEKRLHAFHADGTELGGLWPIQLETIALGKTIADVDHDGKPDIVGVSQDSVTRGEVQLRYLYVIRGDGSIMAKWDLPVCDSDSDRPRTFPAVANLDNDPDLEIVVVQGCSTLAMFDLSQQAGPSWVATVDGEITASPVIGDLDHDGHQEIIVGSFDSEKAASGGVYAFDEFGKKLSGWPVLVRESFETAAALADFDHDGELEIVIPSWSSRKIHLLRKNGFEAPGWPVQAENRGSVRGTVTIADVDGDEHSDVILTTPGVTSQAVWMGDLSYLTGVSAWGFDGQPIDLNPNTNILSLVMESSGGQNRLKGAPATVCDLDGDGKLDLLAFSIQDARYQIGGPPSQLKNRSTLYAWTLGVAYDPEFAPWPGLQGGPRQDGLYRIPPHRNRPPLITNLPGQSIQRGASFLPVRLDHFVFDPDHSSSNLTWQVSTGAALSAVVDSDRVLHVTPKDPAWLGKEAIELRVTDPLGLFDQITVSFQVLQSYVPPIANLDLIETHEDSPVEFHPLANDTDPSGNPLSVINMSRAAVGRIEPRGNGVFRYVPQPDFHGDDTASYIVSNGNGGIAIGEILFRVKAVNDPPEARPDQLILDEDETAIIDLLANDSDVDGDPISISDVESPKHGRLEDVGGGRFRYVPDLNYNGEDSFGYTISDALGAQSKGVASVVIRPVNDSPVAASQEFFMNRNTSLSITFSADDADADTPTFKVMRGPKNGELFSYPNVAAYTPKRGFSGKDSFTYVAMDASTVSSEAVVKITVLDANNPPVAQSRTLTTKIDQPLNLHLVAIDADEDPLEFKILTLPKNGVITGSGTNYIYTPGPGFLGDDQFTFEARDGQTNSAKATISLKVTDLNSAPSVLGMRISTRVNVSTNLTLDAFDPEGNPLSFYMVLAPNHGRIQGKMPDITYVPDVNFVGSDRFSYKANDGEFDSNEGTVVIDVFAPNSPPVTTDQIYSLVSNQPFSFVLDARDADGDRLVCPVLKGPKHGRVYGIGTNLTYVPAGSFVGQDSFTFKAWDGSAYSREAKVTLFVNPTPPEDKLVFEDMRLLEDNAIQLTLSLIPGKEAILEQTENFVDWTEVQKVFTPAARVILTVKPAQDGKPRFFRLRSGAKS